VALIGASGDPARNTARPQRYLRKHGYSGRIVPINPGRREILGEAAYATLADAPVDVDHAFIMVEDVERALEDCGRRACRWRASTATASPMPARRGSSGSGGWSSAPKRWACACLARTAWAWWTSGAASRSR